MIPKKIHYCWFGGNPLPVLAQKCITSWKKHCPDYEIIEWNESNFDINCCYYVREAYDAKKWAFVSDVARLYALVKCGGIYMDTDVEVIKPLDDLLDYDAFSGFETKTQIPTGIMSCSESHPLFAELLHDYDNMHFIRPDGSYDLTTNVTRITKTCLKYGLRLDDTFQTVNDFTLFPHDYFCPKSIDTGIVTITDNTYTIHHFNGSWLSDESKYELSLKQKYCKFLPKKAAGYAAKFNAVVKYRGLKKGLKETAHWLTRKTFRS